MGNNSKIVLFDMGNTLLHFHFGKTDEEKDAAGIRYLTNYLRQFNGDIEIDDVKKDFFDKWQEVMPLRKLNHIEYPVEDYLNDFLEKYDVKFELEDCIKALDAFYTDYRNNLWIEDDIHKTLETIRKRGYRIGVVSNSSLYDEVMINCFKKVGLDKYIDIFTFSYYLKVCKPKEGIFKTALDRMGINPKTAIMVGDNLQSDIKPAKTLGLTGIWFNKNHTLNNTGIKPHIEIHSLKELLDIL